MSKAVDYRIISKPDYIKLECPHCKRDIKVDFKDIDFEGDNWNEGGYCDCPVCEEEIELGDWEDYGFLVKDGDAGSDCLCLYDNSIDYINTIATAEVIGNKFDNPELLEVEK